MKKISIILGLGFVFLLSPILSYNINFGEYKIKKNNISQSIKSTSNNNFFIENNKILFFSGNYLKYFNIGKNTKSYKYINIKDKKNIKYSNKNILYISGNNLYRRYKNFTNNGTGGKINKISTYTDTYTFLIDKEILYRDYFNKGDLYIYNIKNKTQKKIKTERPVFGFKKNNKKIYFLNKNNKYKFLDLDKNINNLKNSKLKYNDIGFINNIIENNRFLIFENQNGLYVKNKNKRIFDDIKKITSKRIKDFILYNEKYIIYSTKKGIFKVDITNKDKQKITDLSGKKIKNMEYKGNDYLIYSYNKNIYKYNLKGTHNNQYISLFNFNKKFNINDIKNLYKKINFSLKLNKKKEFNNLNIDFRIIHNKEKIINKEENQKFFLEIKGNYIYFWGIKINNLIKNDYKNKVLIFEKGNNKKIFGISKIKDNKIFLKSRGYNLSDLYGFNIYKASLSKVNLINKKEVKLSKIDISKKIISILGKIINNKYNINHLFLFMEYKIEDNLSGSYIFKKNNNNSKKNNIIIETKSKKIILDKDIISFNDKELNKLIVILRKIDKYGTGRIEDFKRNNNLEKLELLKTFFNSVRTKAEEENINICNKLGILGKKYIRKCKNNKEFLN